MLSDPPNTITLGGQFIADFVSAAGSIQDAAIREIERISKAPETYGYLLLGNWNQTRWVGVGTDYALTWEPSPLKILRLLRMPELRPSPLPTGTAREP